MAQPNVNTHTHTQPEKMLTFLASKFLHNVVRLSDIVSVNHVP